MLVWYSFFMPFNWHCCYVSGDIFDGNDAIGTGYKQVEGRIPEQLCAGYTSLLMSRLSSLQGLNPRKSA